VFSISDLITVSNIYKLYNRGENEVHALDGVSFAIQPGEFLAIVGQSGSGKSTLMNILGCLDTPTSGEYYLDGRNVSGLNESELTDIRNREIGFVFQGFNLIGSLDVVENVELPLLYRGLSKEERRSLAESALREVGLSRRIRHKPSQMSGGQQQRVAIARAIAAKPPIILADEPTGNLDSKSGAAVMDILRSLNAEGRTVVLITHDEKIAASANRVLQIQDGKIVG
jgi:putative ABC transport system ATP-binding protein